MASTIRIRAVASGDTTEVQALVQHPMDSGFVKDAQGQSHSAALHRSGGVRARRQAVFTAYWGPAVSKDPYIKFSFKGAQKGDDLTISWVDNKGATDSLVGKIQ